MHSKFLDKLDSSATLRPAPTALDCLVAFFKPVAMLVAERLRVLGELKNLTPSDIA